VSSFSRSTPIEKLTCLAEHCDTKSQFSRYGYVLIRLFPQWKLKLNALLKQKTHCSAKGVDTKSYSLKLWFCFNPFVAQGKLKFDQQLKQ